MAIVCKRRAHCSSNGIPERSTNGWQLQAALARRATIARSGLTDPHTGAGKHPLRGDTAHAITYTRGPIRP